MATGLFYKETSAWLLDHVTETDLEAEEDLGLADVGLWGQPWSYSLAPLLVRVLFPMCCCVISCLTLPSPWTKPVTIPLHDGQTVPPQPWALRLLCHIFSLSDRKSN